jgi:octaprenyl-diphosphate synthase
MTLLFFKELDCLLRPQIPIALRYTFLLEFRLRKIRYRYMETRDFLEKVKEQVNFWIDSLNDKYISETFRTIESGKMVRSRLMHLIGGEEFEKEMIQLSAIVETIHLASLLHDDVIDDAETRRGVPSVNATEGSKVSIMLGDILYSKAFVELGKYDKEIIEIVAGAVTKLSIGEILDVNLSKEFSSDKDLYLDMIYKKTASLIESACSVSAILSNRDKNQFGEYGKNLGLAFQIIDDILDIVSSSEQLGKPAMNDFVEGKTTLPYIYLYEKSNSEIKNRIESFHKKELSENESSWILEELENSGSLQKALDLAKEFSEKALNSIDKNDVELREIVEALVERSS